MGKFHRTKAGRIEPCGASLRVCPLGAAEHYESRDEAIAASFKPFAEEPASGPLAKTPHIDDNGNEGDWLRLSEPDQELFVKILDRIDWDGDKHDTQWIDGEPIDGEGYHQYFGCLSAGLDVIQDAVREHGEYRQVPPTTEPIRADELAELWSTFKALEARYDQWIVSFNQREQDRLREENPYE